VIAVLGPAVVGGPARVDLAERGDQGSGWYRIADAIAILGTLPGDYARTVAELRASQHGEAA